jgi:hypothetical protein
LAHTREPSSARATAGGYAITGTVEDPHVAQVSSAETQASLKQ